MDSDPHLQTTSSSEIGTSSLKEDGKLPFSDEEDPYSLNGPYVSLLGLAISFAMLLIPLLVVVRQPPFFKESFVPNDLDRNGSQPSSTISLPRISKPRS